MKRSSAGDHDTIDVGPGTISQKLITDRNEQGAGIHQRPVCFDDGLRKQAP